jgi:hypothetical protein
VKWLLAFLFVASLSEASEAGAFADKKKAEPAAQEPAPATQQKQTQKSKTYTFTGLDIDGKLKTPQLLYFLNRMKSEFDTTTPSRKSFLPELKRSTDEM